MIPRLNFVTPRYGFYFLSLHDAYFPLKSGSLIKSSMHLLSVQFLSFSCSFRQKFCQIIGFCPLLRSWRLPGKSWIPHCITNTQLQCRLNIAEYLYSLKLSGDPLKLKLIQTFFTALKRSCGNVMFYTCLLFC